MNWIVSAAVMFLLKEVAAWDSSANWADVKTKVDGAINDHLPVFAQEGVDQVANTVVDCASAALADTADLQKCASDVLAGNTAQALADLEALLAKVVNPAQPQVLAGVKLARAQLAA
jgi:hypothetical protein